MATHSELSIKISNVIDKQTRKNEGIFFTSRTTTQECINSIREYLKDDSTILEPSCGTGEFLSAILAENKDANITAIENNKVIYEHTKEFELSYKNVTLICDDFFNINDSKKYDIIIGNPPYFIVGANTVDKVYKKYYSGRPNIFVLFIIKSLSLLAPDGILCFVLPTSFLNCIYYNKTREYIYKSFTILNLFESNGGFIDTSQKTFVMVIKNTLPGSPPSPIVFLNEVNTVFGTTQNIAEQKRLVENTTTIHKLGFSVKIGSVVWNEKKAILTDDPTKTRLIHSADIKNGVVGMETFKNPEKKNYINMKGLTGKTLLVPRGYGVGNYTFKFVLYDSSEPYLVENHIMCITGPSNPGLLERIIKSFNDPRTKTFINLYFKNNAINCTEMAKILPIY